jgi:hypothetical protein
MTNKAAMPHWGAAVPEVAFLFFAGPSFMTHLEKTKEIIIGASSSRKG